MFEVSQFDSYAYLFDQPRFISLQPGVTPGNIPVEGMRIGINGAEAAVGQAYANLDTAVTNANYSDAGVALSPLGTIVAQEKGADSDMFFLTFDRIGSETYARTDDTPLSGPPPVDLPPSPEVGLRTFDEISLTMSQITGVSPQNADVRFTYQQVRQQLPTVASIEGFLSAHQVGVAQMAIEYCNALVDDTNLRSQFFPGFDFNASVVAAFDPPADRSLVLDPLYDEILGQNLGTQPLRADVDTRVNQLIDDLTVCGAGCPPGRTETVVKSSCAAVLGSAGMLLK